MKVCGFTIVRNAVKYDYPVCESIRSVLPLVDEFIVLVGNSDDETLRLIESIGSSKVKIHHSVWDDNLREGGRVLAVETDKAQALIGNGYDWAIYIQADEVLPEKSLEPLKSAMQRWKNDSVTEGLLLNYLHFYGSYKYVADSPKWYRAEIRVIRPDKGISSWKDAQGFRKDGRKLCVRRTEATMHHYGWVKPPELQQAKQRFFHRLWHSDDWVNQHVGNNNAFDYAGIDSVRLFVDSHPEVMQERISKQNWEVTIDVGRKNLKFTYRIARFLDKLTGWRPGEYKNYKVID
jgi:glycosyltransferase involved in cell wall biosynthesis